MKTAGEGYKNVPPINKRPLWGLPGGISIAGL